MLGELKQIMELRIKDLKHKIAHEDGYVDTSLYIDDMNNTKFWLKQVNNLIERSLPKGTPITIMVEVPLVIGDGGFYSGKDLDTIDDCKEEALLDIIVDIENNKLKFTHKIG
jgi:enamine deaminase RidA (YjgF/YER057c/UK114 family)